MKFIIIIQKKKKKNATVKTLKADRLNFELIRIQKILKFLWNSSKDIKILFFEKFYFNFFSYWSRFLGLAFRGFTVF